nr:hypothetical protein [Tanacetum cinerariifolium]
AAVGDDIVRALGYFHVLAVEVPADIHQFHCIEGAAAAPGRTSRVGGLPIEIELY